MARPRKSPLAALLQGLAAGAVGTAVFTAYQLATGKTEAAADPPRDWSEAPTPAQVGKRVAEGVFEHDVSLKRAGTVTQIVHWLYGTSWGALYGLLEESIRSPAVSGLALTSAVMASDYTVLPAMKLYDPPWRYPAKTLAGDFGTHLVHGYATAAAFRALEPVFGRR
jgi:hypothetical protein